MQCPQCGYQNPDGNQFCIGCGAALEAATPQPQQPEGGQTVYAAPPAKKKRGCWACGIGCGVVLVLFACAALLAVGWYFRWPAQLGLVESPGRTLFESSPDPYASEALMIGLEEAGVAVEGLSIYVVTSEQGESIAYVVADESDGFLWSGPTYDNAIEGLLIHTAATQEAFELGIDRVAVDYRGAEGEQVAVMTAPYATLVAYYHDAISQEQLFEEMNGRAGGTGGLSISLGGE